MKNIIAFLLILSLAHISLKINAQVIVLKTQDEVNNYPTNFTSIHTLIIRGIENQNPNERIVDLSPLSVIDSIVTKMEIKHVYFENLKGLENLKFISNLNINNCENLKDISQLQNTLVNRFYLSECQSLSKITTNINNLFSVLNCNSLDETINLTSNGNIEAIGFVNCNSIKNISIYTTKDTVFKVTFWDNANLEKVYLNVISSGKKFPSNYVEAEEWDSKFMFENNEKLSEIVSVSNHFGLTSYTVKNNPLLNDLCIIRKSIEYFKDVYSNDSYTWNILNNIRISNNGLHSNSADDVLFSVCSSTSINEVLAIDTKYNLYPNPYTGGGLQIQGLQHNAKVSVYNAMGQVVHSSVYILNTLLELPPLAKGLYLVTIDEGYGLQTLKLFVD
jgi:hypothetical protein